MSEPLELQKMSILDRIIRFCLEMKIIVFLAVVLVLGWGIMVAPFDWDIGFLPRDPVPVDAIPDIGENQQIVFTEWMGHSPQDIEDQVSYPLTVSLLGIPGVKTVRSYSMFGFSSIYVIFKEDVEFYWSRSRVLEKLNSLPFGTLPSDVRPVLGPDATALGQIFWYTLEGRDLQGNPAGGWGLHELRTIQDWYVRYSLLAADGISEVASVGGFVQEYQIDVDPAAMRAHNIGISEVISAVRMSNSDVGARTIEVNKVEYVIRGLGFIEQVSDIESSVVKVNDNVPLYIKDIARVTLGPALRRGALDKEGAEAVGGVAVVRYGDNPLAAINNLKKKIEEIAPGLPKKTLPDGTVSQVTIVPFYDRAGLIHETLGTLNAALSEEILVTIIVVLVMVMHLQSSVLISALLPLAVLLCFICMKVFRVDANIVALSGIAIAIGTMVDMGIIICENIIKHLDDAGPDDNLLEVVFSAAREVGSAVLTAVATTVVSFLPVFTMEAAEGKLFKPLAFTKTFALIASVIVALTIIPPCAHLLFSGRIRKSVLRVFLYGSLIVIGVWTAFVLSWWAGILFIVIGLYNLLQRHLSAAVAAVAPLVGTVCVVALVGIVLANHWLPLGPEKGVFLNIVFVALLLGGVLAFLKGFVRIYRPLLYWCLCNKKSFLMIPLVITVMGAFVWIGFDSILGWLPGPLKRFKPVSTFAHAFPGLGKEFMPPLDEGSFLLMPTTMPHASIGEALDVLQKQDMAIKDIPEVYSVVGKLGRAETPLDPAPISMFETVINYYPEFLTDTNGRRPTYAFDYNSIDVARDMHGVPVRAPDGKPYNVRGTYERDDKGNLVPDSDGLPFRLWRPALFEDINEGRQFWYGIRNSDDIWNEIVRAAEIPGTTSAPRLQPISARIVMLQSGMRAPIGIKVKGPDLESIEQFGLQLERLIKEVPSVEPAAVFADRIVGKPYLEIDIDRKAIARYGIMVANVQEVIETAIGGKTITTTVEGRERYPVRIRYLRELRDSIEDLDRILIPAASGAQIPLIQLADIRYVRGPQVIKSEDTFLIGYVLFDKKPGFAEVDVVEQARAFLHQKILQGELEVPAGVSYVFAGSYENQVRAQQKLAVILPLALFIIFVILYLQFRSAVTTAFVFAGIVVCWSGGFIMIWLYGQEWFMNFSFMGINLRDMFNMQPVNLSVAVWVGFLALFGIASDNGVVVATYLKQMFADKKPTTVADIRQIALEAGLRRVRPCMMTTATTILALIPILTSTGRGSDIMIPMAIPSFGGMVVNVVTILIVPVLYCAMEEGKLMAS
ncbi:MAG: efflux RND transporter permease subunit [bacterium]|nr:efflux RND transporter permease subunit [bacterium]